MGHDVDEARAVLMREYGPPEVLTVSRVSLPPLEADEVRIRTVASAVNHTDLEIRTGNWPVRRSNPFPYIPGVEVVGEIEAAGEAVLDFHRGDRVVTMMQGLGGVRAERPGGYAEFVTVSATAVAPVPSDVDLLDMAAVGLAGVTAYEGLRRIGPLADRHLLVAGAAGGVGSMATQIARAQGASVTGLISRPDHADHARAHGTDRVIVSPTSGPPPALQPANFDGVLDTVGGNLFGRCVEALRPGGVLSLVGAVTGGHVCFDAWQLIRPVTLTGFSSEELDGQALRNAIVALTGWLTDGSIRPPLCTVMPLAEASRAHTLLEERGIIGRILLVP